MHPTTELLEKARSQVSFNLDELTNLLYGGPKMLELVQRAQRVYEQNDKVANSADFFNRPRKQQILEGARKLQAVHNTTNIANPDDWLPNTLYFNSTTLSVVSCTMSIPAIKYLGTDEQFALWGPKFLTFDIICCYAQTEIGHGSDVQNLETTATYDKNTESFIIHSPTVTSTKFWPGELGLLSTHALVYAQLIIDGERKGVYPFMCQIRDTQTHRPLPGIMVGDIGPKMGYQTKDNGFLAFNQYKVPRIALLARYNRVDADGKFSKHGNEKISYASMMIIRKLIAVTYPRIASQSLTIAIRYSIVRTQFRNDEGVENSVLEYQTQQDKLLPRLASCFATIFGGLKVNDIAEDNFHRVYKKDFSHMQSTHAILSGTKAWYSQNVIDTTEWCRLSCGGHGYAHYSGLPQAFFDSAPNVTLEGENQVLYLQVARYLLKLLQYQQSQKNQDRIPFYFSFIKDIPETLSSDSKDLGQLLKLSLTLSLVQVASKLQAEIKAGTSFQDAWNHRVGIYLINVSQRYIEYFNYIVFNEVIDKAVTAKEVLKNLRDLYAIQLILDNPQSLIEGGKITAQDLVKINQFKLDLLTKVKPEAIGLVDAFKYSDSMLGSTIGAYDGKPYERTYDFGVNQNSMNTKAVYQEVQNLKQVKLRSKL